MSSHSLDIILPCYNPSPRWVQQVADAYTKVCNALPDTKVQLIIVNDGSDKDLAPDFDLLRKMVPHLIIESYPVNRGKGFALRRGVAMSTGELIIYTDIDFPYKEEGLIHLYHALADGKFDVALAVRNAHYYRQVPFMRKIMSRVLKAIIRQTLRLPTSDTQAGLKGFNLRGKDVFLQTTIHRYLFDLEFICLVTESKLNVVCVPVELKSQVHFTRMNMKIALRESLNLIKIIFRRGRFFPA
ncbi:MAG: hypothetical protein KatS3mg031_2451 [Chitinophagales bacterium]|nr:MAG: hypothetical protein KatS3mg031_2451 [Chitinophagales bacterium]